jgi:hypothetical protein
VYGTIAYLQAKPGTEGKLIEQFREKVPGLVASYVYRLDGNANTHYAAVMFENKAAYLANANSPEQRARYGELMKILTAEPEWHDGEIIFDTAYGL